MMGFCFHIGPCMPGCPGYGQSTALVPPVQNYIVGPSHEAEVKRLRLALRRILESVGPTTDAGQIALDALAGAF